MPKRKRGSPSFRRNKRTRKSIRRRARLRRGRARYSRAQRRQRFKRGSIFQKGGIPSKCLTKLTYSQHISLSTAQQIAGVYSFRGNGCNDPDLSGTGHQPMMWDQLKTYYGHYKVVACAIKIKDIIIGTSNNIHTYRIGLRARIGSESSTNYMGDVAHMIEDGIKSKIVTDRDNMPLTTVVKGFRRTKNLLDNYESVANSATTSDPTSTGDTAWHWDVVFASIDNATPATADGLKFNVELTYYVLFTDPEAVGQS